MRDRAILTPLNEHVNMLNDITVLQLPGEEVIYYSYDSVSDDASNFYQPEFLNTLTPGNLPPHKLKLKVGAPIMLLRNIDPKFGLCNGTRLLCRRFAKNVIEAEILTGHFEGNSVFLPRIPLNTAEDIKLPFQLTRKQFPVRLSFGLTINKSQGQTFQHVGIYLPNNVFSHGQLYVALSRGTSRDKTTVLVQNGKIDNHTGIYTANVVYKEIFAQLQHQHRISH
ncbi:hypothetical protein KSP39_PZI020910 [Platanthera zijinensis]|uniref:DNA helicase Pif1-like 2B domain-containing protein n=1 Tax=Platanthera zijinensis TaxID=2320716 RepID=A0AAP0AZS3_9ASPA